MCRKGLTELVKKVLELTPNVQVLSDCNPSPIWNACCHGQIRILEVLLCSECGDLEYVAPDGTTPSFMAFIKNNEEVVQYLEKYSSESLCNIFKETTLDVNENESSFLKDLSENFPVFNKDIEEKIPWENNGDKFKFSFVSNFDSPLEEAISGCGASSGKVVQVLKLKAELCEEETENG